MADAQVVPLKLVVAAIISPQGTVENYSDLAQHLSQKLNCPVELVQQHTYAEVNDLVAQDVVDLAFVCTSAYVAGHDTFGMDLLVAPEFNHQQIYYSMLIVPADSPAKSMADLQGKAFAFTDPITPNAHAGRCRNCSLFGGGDQLREVLRELTRRKESEIIGLR